MLSISRSRYTRLIQFVFLACNGVGLVVGLVYNSKTPNLYPNNAHHKLGWVVSCIMLAQAIIGMMSNGGKSTNISDIRPLSRERSQQNYFQRNGFRPITSDRYSQDSGHGTISSPGSRSTSCSEERRSPLDFEQVPLHLDNNSDERSRPWLAPRKESWTMSARMQSLLRVVYNTIDRTILLLSFATLATGWITYGGLFKGPALFSGLAHFIKGGVFFWLGVLALGRWAGSFQDIGWAWNLRPMNVGSRVPSAEFVESFLIFFYGATNVFLEHLAAWGEEWSAEDLEHISLTIMFFGGGLVSANLW